MPMRTLQVAQAQPAWLLPALNGLMQPVADRARLARGWWRTWRDDAAQRLLRLHADMGGARVVAKGGFGERARELDEQCLRALECGFYDAVLEIGCGLSTRAERLSTELPWYGLDGVPLYRCWSCFFQETERYRFIPAGRPLDHWLRYLRRRCRSPLVIMECHGQPPAATAALNWRNALQQCFPSAALVLDKTPLVSLAEPARPSASPPRGVVSHGRRPNPRLARVGSS